jgi:hypothetical protein
MLKETLINIIVSANAVVQRRFARNAPKNKEYPQDTAGTVLRVWHRAI